MAHCAKFSMVPMMSVSVVISDYDAILTCIIPTVSTCMSVSILNVQQNGFLVLQALALLLRTYMVSYCQVQVRNGALYIRATYGITQCYSLATTGVVQV